MNMEWLRWTMLSKADWTLGRVEPTLTRSIAKAPLAMNRLALTLLSSILRIQHMYKYFRRLSSVLSGAGQCDLHRLLDGKPVNRHTASQTFYDVLVMACRGAVRVKQTIPYGPMAIELRTQ